MKQEITGVLGKEVFITDDARFYRYQKHNGKFIAYKIEPVLQNDFLEIYAIHLKDNIVYLPVAVKGKRKLLVPFIKNEKVLVSYLLMGEDFAFGVPMSAPWGSAVNWKLIAKLDGEYQDVSSAYCKNTEYISFAEYENGVVKLHIKAPKFKDEDIYLVKTTGGYQRITCEEAEKKKKNKALIIQPVPKGWQELKSLGIFDEDLLLD